MYKKKIFYQKTLLCESIRKIYTAQHFITECDIFEIESDCR